MGSTCAGGSCAESVGVTTTAAADVLVRTNGGGATGVLPLIADGGSADGGDGAAELGGSMREGEDGTDGWSASMGSESGCKGEMLVLVGCTVRSRPVGLMGDMGTGGMGVDEAGVHGSAWRKAGEGGCGDSVASSGCGSGGGMGRKDGGGRGCGKRNGGGDVVTVVGRWRRTKSARGVERGCGAGAVWHRRLPTCGGAEAVREVLSGGE